MDIPNYTMNDGNQIPTVGLGTWKSKPGEVTAAVKAGIEAGYRHIDCALVYGNEAEVGAALKEKLGDGSVKREDLFITSKLWNTKHQPADVRPSLKESLADLGIEYLDLYLIHWPTGFKAGDDKFPKDDAGNILYDPVDIADTWKAMELLVDEGLVKSIGVSNFNSAQVDRIVKEGRIKPAINQVEIHPYFSNDKLAQHCLKQGVGVTAYSPLGSPDRPWAKAGEPTLIEDPKLKEIADKYGKTPAQIVLRWVLQRGLIVIPKSVTPSRIRENFNILDFQLSEEDMSTVNQFDRDTRLIVPVIEKNGKRVFRDANHPNFPFNIPY